MLRNLFIKIVKVFIFTFSFVAYWYSLDEKFYLYREQKMKNSEESGNAAI